MPMAMMNPPYSLLGLALRFQDSQPSSLSLINHSSLRSLRSLCSPISLVSKVDFNISLFYFETKSSKSKSFFPPLDQTLVAGCYCFHLTLHLGLDIAASLCFHHGSSQPLSLGFLVSNQVNFLPSSSLFFCILCL